MGLQLIVEHAKHQEENGMVSEFDGMWSSSLTDSTSKGKRTLNKSTLLPDCTVLMICWNVLQNQ